MHTNSHSQRFNAVKHGLYAEAIVLPDEDLEAFRRSRQLAFLEFRPQTVDEAELVDTLVECRWQFKRCRRFQAQVDQQTLDPNRDAAQRLVEPVTHQRTHTSMDVTVHRNRIDKLESRTRAKLWESQKLRRLGLVEGAVKLPPGCYMDVDGDVVQVVEAPRVPTRVCQVAQMVPAARPTIGTTDSEDTRNGFSREQKETGVMPIMQPRVRMPPVDVAAWLAVPSSGGWTG